MAAVWYIGKWNYLYIQHHQNNADDICKTRQQVVPAIKTKVQSEYSFMWSLLNVTTCIFNDLLLLINDGFKEKGHCKVLICTGFIVISYNSKASCALHIISDALSTFVLFWKYLLIENLSSIYLMAFDADQPVLTLGHRVDFHLSFLFFCWWIRR